MLAGMAMPMTMMIEWEVPARWERLRGSTEK